MTTKRVLVTGATGFVGRASLRPLAARGYEVHAVHLNAAPVGGVATWHRADLLNPTERDRLIDEVRPTHLVHFAWYAVHGLYWTSVENLRWVEASLGLLRRFADRGGRRAVVAGTCAEYDWRCGFCSEGVTPTNPATLYGVSKNALHAVSAAFAQLSGVSLAWGRIFFPFGPWEAPRRLIPSVVRAVLSGEPVRCSHGRQYRDFLFVEDCADAFSALLDSGVEGAVNIGSGQPRTIAEVVAAVVARMSAAGVPVEFGAVPTAADDPPALFADVRRLTGEVGWVPRNGWDEALDRTITYWRAAGDSGLPVTLTPRGS